MNTETSRAKAAEVPITVTLANEISRAVSVDTILNAAVAAGAESQVLQLNSLSIAVVAVTTNLNTVTTNLNAEIVCAKGAETAEANTRANIDATLALTT